MKFSGLTKPELDEIIENANFTEEELRIFKLLVGNMSLEQVSQRLMYTRRPLMNLTKSTINAVFKGFYVTLD